MDWRHRDWLWVMVCISLTFGAAHANDIQVMNLISYGATFVSISLAFVAIYISVREATKADNLKGDLSMILGELKEKVGQVDNKLSFIDPDTVAATIVKRPLDEFHEDLIEKIESVTSVSREETVRIAEEETKKLYKKLKDDLVQEIIKANNKPLFKSTEAPFNRIISDRDPLQIAYRNSALDALDDIRIDRREDRRIIVSSSEKK
ncbi:hypothetical protein M5X00_29925 [Paenibacillus alvei]|uniref:Uncharacterized protein n=1 Tax=Paenibacillus alvei TaxID=44250 RepID=A0ABT4H7Y8_PAEAL|nr:hypothetical protein [Paenibacillus alvei]MCY9545200.1 hypothetical protein [Paenibacillus alvei]MCY9708201.1 hypothetical protein [Paenibacillus alvei]MCY9737909.1 hypothetical protein [Paenibacillus alvei]MCY9758441.1 hypothetical protein [Paenibacillus alvei]MCY9765101.1 hypothetical protein [Paenibacillus alvei]